MGEIKIGTQTTPATPDTGLASIFVDSATKKLKTVDDAGAVTDYTPSAGEANTASNVGGGSEVFKAKTGVNLAFRTLVATGAATVTQVGDTIEVGTSPASGEANTASNVGAGSQVFKQKTGVDLEFRSIIGSGSAVVTQTADTVNIAVSASSYDPQTFFQIDEDFMSGSDLTTRVGQYGWQILSGGTGNNQTRIPGEAGHPGIFRLACGTVATGRSFLTLGEAGLHCLLLGGGVISFEWIFRATGTLAAHLNSGGGLGDSFAAAGDQTNGVYLRVLGSDTNWHLVSASGGTRSIVNLGVPFASGSWHRMGFEINSAGTSIQGKVNGADVGSPITTNIPSISISPFVGTSAIAAGTTMLIDTDKYFLKQVLSPAR